jgi:hypothetical protein
MKASSKATVCGRWGVVIVTALAGLGSAAQGWDAIGHRAITWLAMDELPSDAPSFLMRDEVRSAVAWNAAEPDRWRGLRDPFIMNTSYPDHFLDIEDLAAFGMSIDTMPMLRNRAIRDMTLAREKNPAGLDGNAKPYSEKIDPTGQQEWPGFIMQAIAEDQAKLLSHFKTYRILKQLNDPNRAGHLLATEANIISTIGRLSHWVGDAAQPLHTTKHFNGWVGENPQGYTTDKRFHASIDGGVPTLHNLHYNTLKPSRAEMKSAEVQTKLTQAGAKLKDEGWQPGVVWQVTIEYLKRSHTRVEPLYKLEQSGALKQDQGKQFLTMCLHDGATMLAWYINQAWANSTIGEKDVEMFVMYDGFAPEQMPPAPNGAGAKPAGQEAPLAK